MIAGKIGFLSHVHTQTDRGERERESVYIVTQVAQDPGIAKPFSQLNFLTLVKFKNIRRS